MRPFEQLIPLEEALESALDIAKPITTTERVLIWDAIGRVLAEDVVAPIDVPAFDKAAMDGFGLRSGDTHGVREAGVRFRIVATSHAGDLFEGPVGRGECVEVATGAPVPPDCDGVIEVEAVTIEGQEILLKREVVKGRNVSARGEDIRQGETLVLKGTTLKPGHLGTISAVGIGEVAVFDRPRVAVFATGREIRRGGPLRPGEVYDANSSALAGLLRENGGRVEVLDPVPDEYEAILTAVSKAKEYDIVVLSGSTSVGERDFLRDAVAHLGRIVFHGVASKPGKPLLLGQVDETLVFGMPGFPASCLLLAYSFLLPVFRRVARLSTAQRAVTLPLAQDLPVSEDKTQLVTVHLAEGKAFKAFHRSGSITSVSKGEGYVVVPPGRKLSAGETVEVLLF